MKLLTYQGKTQSIPVWAKQLAIDPQRIRQRLRSGRSIPDALSQEILPHGFKWDFFGERMTVREIAQRCHVPVKRIQGRLKRGWTIGEAATYDLFQPLRIQGRTLKEWADASGLSVWTIRRRYYRGKPFPTLKGCPPVMVQGKTYQEWAEETGLTVATIKMRHYRGQPLDTPLQRRRQTGVTYKR